MGRGPMHLHLPLCDDKHTGVFRDPHSSNRLMLETGFLARLLQSWITRSQPWLPTQRNRVKRQQKSAYILIASNLVHGTWILNRSSRTYFIVYREFSPFMVSYHVDRRPNRGRSTKVSCGYSLGPLCDHINPSITVMMFYIICSYENAERWKLKYVKQAVWEENNNNLK